jgi:hypothetical protein
VKGYPAEFLHHPPSPQHPRDLGLLASSAHLQIVDYAPAIEGKINPKPSSEGVGSWLLADDPQHGNFSMGLANIELKRGTASSVGAGVTPAQPTRLPPQPEEVELEESIFAFSNAPDEQIGHVRKGGSTGAKVRLVAPVNGNKGYVVVSAGEKETIFDVAKNLGRDVPIENTPFSLRIENYWPDFRIENGKPSSFSDEPNNPAVLVTLLGKGVPVSETETNRIEAAKN